MLEESAPSILAAVYGWFTPTVLFVLLNLVIGTIAVTSKGAKAHHKDDEVEDRKLQRPPSVLERLKSINLYRYKSGEIPLETAAAAPLQTRIEPVETFETLDDAYVAAVATSSQEHHISRSQSDSSPTGGEMPAKLPGKLKKSASAKSAFSHFEETEIPRRPETVREIGTVDEEVDAKADDFINRFRQQLKLQRLDSILRYKEMINRGK